MNNQAIFATNQQMDLLENHSNKWKSYIDKWLTDKVLTI